MYVMYIKGQSNKRIYHVSKHDVSDSGLVHCSNVVKRLSRRPTRLGESGFDSYHNDIDVCKKKGYIVGTGGHKDEPCWPR